MIPILSIALFLSGASALIFEFLWFRLAGIGLGNSVWSAAIVLASFMGGLAIGNYLTVLFSAKIKKPLTVYVFLECIIGISGVCIVFLFPHLTNIFTPLFRPILDNALILNGLRSLIAISLMILPASAMGATLPVIIKALNQKLENFGHALGWLYGWNTFGAVSGVLIAELYLVRMFGLQTTGIIAAALNILAAILALILIKTFNPASSNSKITSNVTDLPKAPNIRHLLVLSFFSGFTFLILEIVWFRFLLLFFDARSLHFAIMLAVVLSGLSLGSFFISYAYQKKLDPTRWLSHILFINGIFIVLIYRIFYFIINSLPTAITSLFQYYGTITLPSLFLMMPISVLSGMIFTIVGKAIHAEIPHDAKATGLLTLTNTVGAMLGSLLAGAVLIPFIGIEKSFFFCALAYGAMAAYFSRKNKENTKSLNKFKWVFKGLFIIVIVFFPHGFMMNYLDLPINSYSVRRESRAAYKEGAQETIQYLEKTLWDQPYYHRLITNNHSMASTKFMSKRYMKMYGFYPMALHPNLKTAALICYGTGMTAETLTHNSSLEKIDIIDISKDVIEMNSVVFPHADKKPANNPRVRVFIEDGRFFLQTTPTRYDLITGEPPPPTFRGISNLYSQEYFQLMYNRLQDGGMVTYWLPVTQMDHLSTKSILKAFCNVFSDCTLWQGSHHDWMMMGTRQRLKPTTAKAFTQLWEDPHIGRELRSLGFEEPAKLGSFFIADSERIHHWVADVAPLQDNYPYRLNSTVFVTKEDTQNYDSFRGKRNIKDVFAQSPDIAKIWPPTILKETLPHFHFSQTLFDMPSKNIMKTVQKLHMYISSSQQIDFHIGLTLNSDIYAHQILEKHFPFMNNPTSDIIQHLKTTLARHQKNKEIIKIKEYLEITQHLAVRSLIQRDFNAASLYYKLLSEQKSFKHHPLVNYMRVYLNFMDGNKEEALKIMNKYSLYLHQSEPKNIKKSKIFWQWVLTLSSSDAIFLKQKTTSD